MHKNNWKFLPRICCLYLFHFSFVFLHFHSKLSWIINVRMRLMFEIMAIYTKWNVDWSISGLVLIGCVQFHSFDHRATIRKRLTTTLPQNTTLPLPIKLWFNLTSLQFLANVFDNSIKFRKPRLPPRIVANAAAASNGEMGPPVAPTRPKRKRVKVADRINQAIDLDAEWDDAIVYTTAPKSRRKKDTADREKHLIGESELNALKSANQHSLRFISILIF